MDRMLVVVFDNETKAFEGEKALLQLDSEGRISVYGHAVLAKNLDGSAVVKQVDSWLPSGTLAGTALGTLIGLVGGPAGVAIGAAMGAVGGGAADLHNARIGHDFIDDVAKALLPSSVAVMADIDETWTTPVDTRMEALGGIVFRRALSEIKHTIHDEHIAAIKADLAQMKAEHAKARADRRIKLHEKINQLESRLQHQLEKAKERRQAAEREAQAKAELLKNKAAAAKAQPTEEDV